jgi:DNA-directed RNA polymerase subunit H
MGISIHQIFKSRKNILDMFEEQDYDVNKYKNFSHNEISVMFEHDGLDMFIQQNENIEEKSDTEKKTTTKRKDKIYIRFYLKKTFRSANIQEIVEELFVTEEKITKNDTLYIIIKDEPNDTIRDQLKHFWEKDQIFVVVQNIKRLQFNIMNLTQVPKQRIITDKEKKQMLEKYNIKDLSDLPEISRFEPIAQVLCLRPGMISVSLRPSKTSITTEWYRLCI